jgi:hypothetical protein
MGIAIRKLVFVLTKTITVPSIGDLTFRHTEIVGKSAWRSPTCANMSAGCCRGSSVIGTRSFIIDSGSSGLISELERLSV